MSFASPIAADSGLIVDRAPSDVARAGLPAGFRAVSADNHIEVTRDIFVEGFPEHLRHAAPQVWLDGYWRIGDPGAVHQYPEGIDVDTALVKANIVDGFDMARRNGHLDVEGIAQEIVYPQSLLAFVRHPDHAVQEAIYRCWNQYMAECGRESLGRFFGVGICPNWWDPASAEAAVAQVVDLGLKSFMLPYSPGLDNQGQPIDYGGKAMERFWAIAEEAGLPVSFHIGEVPGQNMRGGFGTLFLTQAAPFRRVFGNLIFGGILDRNPGLQVVFAEGGINWVAGALQDAELTFGAHREVFDIVPEMRPSDYWRRNMHATFQTDAVGLRLIDQIGADRVMWAQDYPHGEGTFGYTAEAMRAVIDAAGDAGARAILGDNARRLYRLEIK